MMKLFGQLYLMACHLKNLMKLKALERIASVDPLILMSNGLIDDGILITGNRSLECR